MYAKFKYFTHTLTHSMHSLIHVHTNKIKKNFFRKKKKKKENVILLCTCESVRVWGCVSLIELLLSALVP